MSMVAGLVLEEGEEERAERKEEERRKEGREGRREEGRLQF